MNRMKLPLRLLPCLLLAGCYDIPPGAYYNRGDPENLIDVSTEIVSIPMAAPDDLNALKSLLRNDPPTRAELACNPDEALCATAAHLLDDRDIPASYAAPDGEGEPEIALSYERIVARDCENRYIDNSHNNHNLPPPTMGCSITSNMVQMVTDKQQFTNPNLMDYPDAEKAVQAYDHYMHPPAEAADTSDDSLLSTVSAGQ